MGVIDSLKAAGLPIPSLGSVSMGSAYTVVAVVLGAMIFAALLGFAGWVLLDLLKHKFRIPLYRDVGGEITLIKVFKAKPIVVDQGGATLLKVKGTGGKHLTWPHIWQGRFIANHLLKPDGDWSNFGLESFKDLKDRVRIKVVDEDMRLNRAAIQRLLTHRYHKTNFWKEYGPLLAHIMLIIVEGFVLIMILKSQSDYATITAGSMGAIAEKLDNIATRACAAAPLLFMFPRKWLKL